MKIIQKERRGERKGGRKGERKGGREGGQKGERVYIIETQWKKPAKSQISS